MRSRPPAKFRVLTIAPAAGAIGEAEQGLLEIGGARELDGGGEAEVRGVHAADARPRRRRRCER